MAGHYHLSVKSIGRGTARGTASNAVSAAAYRSGSVIAMASYRAGEELVDEKTGEVHDYRAKLGIRETHMLTEQGATVPDWAHDRGKAWNAAERAEPRANARIGTEIEVALPEQLNKDQQRDLAVAYAQAIVDRNHVLGDVSIHDPKHPHAHMTFSHRTIGPDGFGDYANRHTVLKRGREVSVVGIAGQPSDVEKLRAEWEKHVNLAYEKAGLDLRVDHRSFEARGIDREPQVYVGPELKRNSVHAWRREERIAHNGRVAERNAGRETPAQRLQQIGDAHDQTRQAAAAPDPRIITDQKQRAALQEAAEADRAGPSWNRRPATVEDIARELSPKFAAADDARKSLLTAAGQDKQARLDREGDLAWASRNERARREELSGMRAKLHDWGVWRDDKLAGWETRGKFEEGEIQKIIKRQKDRHPKIEKALRQYGKRFASIEPKAKEKLAERQSMAGDARERLSHHREAERERREQERQVERQGQRRGYGISR